MAMPADAFKTYETVGMREDLSDVIKMISPVDTLFYSSLADGGIGNLKVEWQTDALTAADGTNYHLEGADEAPTGGTYTTRIYNMAQIQKKMFAISNTNATTSLKRAGRTSERDYQSAKVGKQLAIDVEYAFLLGVRADGDATNPRKMRGILNWITTNIGYGAGGSVDADGVLTHGTDREFTESILKTMLQNIYVQGGNPSEAYVTPTIKTKMSSWASETSNYRIAVEGQKLGTVVDVYMSDFGTISVKPHRAMPAKTMVILDNAHKGKKATVRNTHRERLAITGDNEKWVMRVEHTLRDVAELAHGRLGALIP
jgi:hypothetical protein